MIKNKKKLIYEDLPSLITFVAIVICAVIFKQLFIKTLPVCVSIVVMLLSARADRLNFIIASLNSVIYIIGYVMEGVYGSVGSTVFGILMMMSAYFFWRKNARGRSTKFRRLPTKSFILLLLGIVLAWVVATVILYTIGGSVPAIDGLVLIMGIIVPILNIFAFIESPILNLASVVCNILLWGYKIIWLGNLSAITYLISAIFNLYMVARQAVRYIQLYNEQKKETKEVD